MRLSITTPFRARSQAAASDDVVLALVEITHPSLSDPIRVVNDTVNFTYDSKTWTAFPYDITVLSDDENPPTASLSLQNVDAAIGEAVQACETPPRMRLLILDSADFNLAVSPRVPVGTPSIQYDAPNLFLANVKFDLINVEAQIVGWDYLQRTWPGIRATQNRLPGLFR